MTVRVVTRVGGTGLGCVTEGAGAVLGLGVWAGALEVTTGATVRAVGSRGVLEGMAVVRGLLACVDALEAGGAAALVLELGGLGTLGVCAVIVVPRDVRRPLPAELVLEDGVRGADAGVEGLSTLGAVGRRLPPVVVKGPTSVLCDPEDVTTGALGVGAEVSEVIWTETTSTICVGDVKLGCSESWETLVGDVALGSSETRETLVGDMALGCPESWGTLVRDVKLGCPESWETVVGDMRLESGESRETLVDDMKLGSPESSRDTFLVARVRGMPRLSETVRKETQTSTRLGHILQVTRTRPGQAPGDPGCCSGCSGFPATRPRTQRQLLRVHFRAGLLLRAALWAGPRAHSGQAGAVQAEGQEERAQAMAGPAARGAQAEGPLQWPPHPGAAGTRRPRDGKAPRSARDAASSSEAGR